jgi:hypothetical protein
MDSTPMESRRANVEDLGTLMDLWSGAGLPSDELGRFLGEFQVVTGPDGRILHAIGLLVEGEEALLHSEAMAQEAGADPDAWRAVAWRRLRLIARNQGVVRIWSREDADYWAGSGFQPVAVGELPATLPSFVQRDEGWWIYRHPEPAQADQMVQREMALWRTLREQEAERFRSRLVTFRIVAFGLFALTMILLLAFLFYASKLKGNLFQILR